MRIKAILVLLLVTGVGITLSLTQGREQEPSPLPRQADLPEAAPTAKQLAQAQLHDRIKAFVDERKGRDTSKFSDLHRQFLLAARRGADWLYRRHDAKGRFAPGRWTALDKPMEADHFVRQCGAAFALARAARFLGGETGKDYAARATQAVLVLLEETAEEKGLRQTTAPPVLVDPLEGAGALLLAICELPDARKELTEKADQLAAFIRKEAKRPDDDEEARRLAVAMHGLAASIKHAPADWKAKLVREAAGWGKGRHSADYAASMLPALAIAGGSEAMAFEMADRVCGWQYDRIEPRRATWYGGFKAATATGVHDAPPTIESAKLAEALNEARRTARERPDLARHERYTVAVGRALQFVNTLQYTEPVTQHYAAWYRPAIVGGFHFSHQDGNLRLDYNRDGVSALFGYLETVAD